MICRHPLGLKRAARGSPGRALRGPGPPAAGPGRGRGRGVPRGQQRVRAGPVRAGRWRCGPRHGGRAGGAPSAGGPARPGPARPSSPSPPIYSVSADVFFRTFSIKFYNGVKDKE